MLAALALDDREYAQHMQVQDELHPPPFYTEFVASVQAKIVRTCQQELECIEREHTLSHAPRCTISDRVAAAIEGMRDSIVKSRLWDNVLLRHAVLARAFPPPLMRLLSIEHLVAFVPEQYLRAQFACELASQYVYAHGCACQSAAFIDFVVALCGPEQQTEGQ